MTKYQHPSYVLNRITAWFSSHLGALITHYRRSREPIRVFLAQPIYPFTQTNRQKGDEALALARQPLRSKNCGIDGVQVGEHGRLSRNVLVITENGNPRSL